MTAAVVVLLILVLVAVIVIAGYLIVIALALSRVNQTLATVISAVTEIPRKTQPVPNVLDGIDRDLSKAAGLLEGLPQRAGGSTAASAEGRVGPGNVW